MSEFDKEAERERLREKYERDQEKRKATQRMSELLLKGATMTNKHCDNCGDPIFRYEGQEFCATCQAEAASQQQQAAEQRAQADAQQEATTDQPQTPTPDDDQQSAVDADAETGTTDAPRTGSATADSGPVAGTPARPAPAATGDEQSLDDAVQTLTRIVTRYAQAADDADDPRRARELLSAAREAAETLDALRR